MARNIAVLMGLINMENQRQILDGMIDAIKETEDNVYVFTNHSRRQNNKENVQSAFHIMELPDFECFDGAIVALDSISHVPTTSYVLDKLRNAKCPFITLGKQVEGNICLQSSGFEAQYKIVEHLINKHGCREFIYVRGPQNYAEADERYEAFVKVLNDYDLVFKEEDLYPGMFTLESGIKAAAEIHSKGVKADGKRNTRTEKDKSGQGCQRQDGQDNRYRYCR